MSRLVPLLEFNPFEDEDTAAQRGKKSNAAATLCQGHNSEQLRGRFPSGGFHWAKNPELL